MELTCMRQFFQNPTNLGNLMLAPGFGTMVIGFVAAVHKTAIHVESEIDKGTIVKLTFPIAKIQRRK